MSPRNKQRANDNNKGRRSSEQTLVCNPSHEHSYLGTSLVLASTQDKLVAEPTTVHGLVPCEASTL